MKLTKRKGFNFFRSYFDVYNELEEPSDKVAFIDALLNRQFMGVKPKGLKGMSKFAYISQTNSIDSQVKGYEDKMKVKLNPLEVKNITPSVGGAVGVKNIILTPSLQVEEKGKEKGKEQIHINPVSDVFLESLCKYFSQTTEPLERKVWAFLNNLNNNGKLKDFETQTKAYVKYKRLADEKVHRWNSYTADWDSENWIDKLSKLNTNDPNIVKKPKTFERYG